MSFLLGLLICCFTISAFCELAVVVYCVVKAMCNNINNLPREYKLDRYLQEEQKKHDAMTVGRNRETGNIMLYYPKPAEAGILYYPKPA